MAAFIENLQGASATYFHVLIGALRWAAPIIAALRMAAADLPAGAGDLGVALSDGWHKTAHYPLGKHDRPQ